MQTAIQIFLSTALGGIILVNGVGMKTNVIIDEALEAVNKANQHQLATVIELYYLDHNKYPQVYGGEELIDELYDTYYLDTKPLASDVFEYYPLNDRDDYYLRIK